MEQVAEPERHTAEDVITVGQLLIEPPGFRRIVYCTNCQERIELPVASLIETYGPAAPLQKVLAGVACPHCASSAIHITMTKLK